MSNGEIILYNTEDGATSIQLKAVDGSIWLSQSEMAELFDTTKQNISLHIKNIFSDEEVSHQGTVKDYLTVQTEGDREVERQIQLYNLDVILAVGMRVRSPRGIQFRRWANTVLKEYLVKGFAMDDERLKDPKHDYFDELLQRIRDIRASEARFYHKIRDILSLSPDYDLTNQASRNFYATIQNKMLYAVTSHTAAELIMERSDPNAPNMGLTSWKKQRVCKEDVTVAKNYLGDEEIRELNTIVTMFLDTAELRAQRRKTIQFKEWEGFLDTFLRANEFPVLHGIGNRSKTQADAIAHRRYETFDAGRKLADRQKMESEPDIDVSVALEDIEKTVRLTRKRRQD
ncbi:virulence RhuM family protein [Gluconobacter frateurii]|uniref:virulence RhuM family protein n=1 Tax=Gluconobacter frateurii TaxID=38308 RepID=UPI001F059C39|nr:RhuM family protein [Gluconobacter frateurii]UMM09539.1 virulence RhuM family protein [Gluconobacter frateurii]